MTALADVKGLRAIEDGVFHGCSSLVSVGLPNTCKTFDQNLTNVPMLSCVEVVASPHLPNRSMADSRSYLFIVSAIAMMSAWIESRNV